MIFDEIKELIEQKEYDQAEELINELNKKDKLRGDIFKAQILFFRSSPIPALKLIEKTLEEAKEQEDKIVEFGSLVIKTFILYNENRLYAIPEHLEAGEILLSQMGNARESREVQEWEANILNVKGSFCHHEADYDKAIEAFKRTFEIHSRLENHDSMAYNLDNIAICYFEKGDYELALEFKLKLLPILEKFDTRKNIAILLNDIGLTYIELENLESAQEYYDKSLKIFEEIDDKKSIILVLDKLVKLNTKRGKDDLVADYLAYIEKLK